MRRREFIKLFGGAAAVWPNGVQAQQPAKVPKIGVLSLSTGQTVPEEGLEQGLRDLGYVEGQTIVLEYQRAGGDRIDCPI